MTGPACCPDYQRDELAGGVIAESHSMSCTASLDQAAADLEAIDRTRLTLACAFGRCPDCPDPGDCDCPCRHTERRCAGCGLLITSDPSGLCLTCQPGYPSEAPESITADQERAITAACADLGILVFVDLDYYSERMAGDVLEVLERARRARKERARCR